MKTKLCGRCEEEKSISSFRKRTLKSGKVIQQSWCRDCQRAWDREYARTSSKRQESLEQSRTRLRVANREFIRNYLGVNPCVDCGENDIVVLEFDHVRGKDRSIATMMSGSLEKLIDEISKCEVRCANCHRRRHALESNTWRTQ